MLDNTQIKQLKEKLSTPKRIVIFPHKNPDGDAIGSTLGLQMVLTKMGHQAEVVSPNDFPKFLKWLPNAKRTIIYEYKKNQAEIIIQDADILFFLDFNTLSRIDNLESFAEKSKAFKVLIDHHQQPDEFDINYSNTQIPATCELIYHFLDELELTHLIDKDIANCLYTGIITDTGAFRFSSVQSSTLFVASQLIEKGAVPYKIYDQIFDVSTPERLKLLSVFLQNMKIFPEYRTALFTLSRTQLEQYGFQKGDTEGFVNYGLSLNDYVFSIFMSEDLVKDFVKISFRSKGDFDVNTFARTHFNGGGHVNAAGGRSDISLEKSVKEFVSLLPQYKEKLQNTQI